MCIAIASKVVEEYYDSLDEAWENNPHGAGIAYLKGGRVRIVKGLMKLNDLKKAIEKHKEFLDGKPHLVHLRVTTSGGTSPQNTHPWKVGKHCAMIHNGVLRYRTTAQKSDTALFAQEVLSPLLSKRPMALHSPWFRAMLEDHLGNRNAMAFLDARSQSIVVFKEEGRGGEGCRSESGETWFSNKSHLPGNWSKNRWRREGFFDDGYGYHARSGGCNYQTSFKDGYYQPEVGVIHGSRMIGDDNYYRCKVLHAIRLILRGLNMPSSVPVMLEHSLNRIFRDSGNEIFPQVMLDSFKREITLDKGDTTMKHEWFMACCLVDLFLLKGSSTTFGLGDFWRLDTTKLLFYYNSGRSVKV